MLESGVYWYFSIGTENIFRHRFPRFIQHFILKNIHERYQTQPYSGCIYYCFH